MDLVKTLERHDLHIGRTGMYDWWEILKPEPLGHYLEDRAVLVATGKTLQDALAALQEDHPELCEN